MQAKEKAPLVNFTIFLIKEDLISIEDIIDKNKVTYSSEISLNNKSTYKIFIKEPFFKPPKWAKIFEDYFDIKKFGTVASSSALLLIQENGRYFAITFGQGRYLLKQNCWEERFGLKVVLNLIADDSIRSLDKKTFDNISMLTREQASKKISAQDFGLDVEKDMVRAVVGYSSDKEFGERISGMDSFKTAVRASLDDLPGLCKIYLNKFFDKSYKHKYPWVDYLAEIKDKSLIEFLDSKLVEYIIAKKFDKCWASIPDIIEWERVAGFRYGFNSRAFLYHDIHLEDFLNERINNNEINIENLKNRFVYAVDEEDNKLNTWSIYNCLYCEITDQNDVFLLSGSKWYKVENNFVEKLNNFFRNSVPRSELILPEYNHSSEKEYNFYVSSYYNDFYLMDQNLIYVNSGKIEFCDLVDNRGHVIHIKRYGASSVLSHLFMQGVNSAELLQTDYEFRKKVNELLPDSHKIKNIEYPPSPEEYEIVFGIISDSDGDNIELPFFSKLTLRNAVKRLYGYRYKVSILKIPVNDQFKKTKKLKPSRKIY